MKIKNITKILIINSFIFGIILIIGELIARSFYPEFKGDIYSENISRDVKIHKGFINDIQLSRIPYKNWKFDNKKGMFLIIGDSFTYGFGTPYEEIYWVKLKSLHNLLSADKLEFVPFASYGNNLSQNDLLINIDKISNHFNRDKKFILYQFNFNDITPINSKNLKKNRLILKDKEIKSSMKNSFLYGLNHEFKKLSWTNLNKSVLFRVSTHFATSMKRIPLDKQTCLEKGLNSLGQYTWTFASKGFEKESEKSWNNFKNDLKDLKIYSDKINAKFYIFVTPTIFDIDRKKVHRHFNSYRLDMSCATINPSLKLQEIANELDINLIDPTEYIRGKFESNIKEGNFIPFYFPADTNHLTPAAQTHLSHYLFKAIF